MKAIILAGGFGTRLQTMLNGIPKPMAPIGSEPFLAYLLRFLKKQGISSVILSVHFLAEKIQDFFGDAFEGMSIDYAVEEKPLGTGGAIRYALEHYAINEPVFILNGDTFVKVNYINMYENHADDLLTIALRPVEDCTRFGKVLVENGCVTAFKEKGESGAGLINAGIYLLQPSLISTLNLSETFSFENELLVPYLSSLHPKAFITNDYFIDIGIPADYMRAQMELPMYVT